MKFHHLLILPIVMAMAACTSTPSESNITTTTRHGVPGGEVVRTTQVRATVTAIDVAKRKLTLVTPKEEKLLVKAGPEVVNIHQIRIGDQFKVTLTEQLVVRMAKPGEKTHDGKVGVIGLAPLGAKPGLVSAETYQTTATITAIDLKARQVTLRFADGTSNKASVRKDVDLTKRKAGERVVIRTTESLAIMLEKP